MDTLIIILPEYGEAAGELDLGKVILYPETMLVPSQQLKKAQDIVDLDYPLVTVITTSPYMIEALIKKAKTVNEKVKLIYSDGKTNTEGDATPIFRLMADPMREMF